MVLTLGIYLDSVRGIKYSIWVKMKSIISTSTIVLSVLVFSVHAADEGTQAEAAPATLARPPSRFQIHTPLLENIFGHLDHEAKSRFIQTSKTSQQQMMIYVNRHGLCEIQRYPFLAATTLASEASAVVKGVFEGMLFRLPSTNTLACKTLRQVQAAVFQKRELVLGQLKRLPDDDLEKVALKSLQLWDSHYSDPIQLSYYTREINKAVRARSDDISGLNDKFGGLVEIGEIRQAIALADQMKNDHLKSVAEEFIVTQLIEKALLTQAVALTAQIVDGEIFIRCRNNIIEATRALMSRGKYDDALLILNEFLIVKKSYADDQALRLANAYREGCLIVLNECMQLRDFQNALNLCVLIHRDPVAIEINKAIEAAQQKLSDIRVEDISACAASAPDQIQAMLRLAQVLVEQGEVQDALEVTNYLPNDTGGTLWWREKILTDKRDMTSSSRSRDDAVTQFLSELLKTNRPLVKELNRETEEMLLQIADASIKSGRPDFALTALQKTRELYASTNYGVQFEDYQARVAAVLLAMTERYSVPASVLDPEQEGAAGGAAQAESKELVQRDLAANALEFALQIKDIPAAERIICRLVEMGQIDRAATLYKKYLPTHFSVQPAATIAQAHLDSENVRGAHAIVGSFIGEQYSQPAALAYRQTCMLLLNTSLQQKRLDHATAIAELLRRDLGDSENDEVFRVFVEHTNAVISLVTALVEQGDLKQAQHALKLLPNLSRASETGALEKKHGKGLKCDPETAILIASIADQQCESSDIEGALTTLWYLNELGGRHCRLQFMGTAATEKVIDTIAKLSDHCLYSVWTKTSNEVLHLAKELRLKIPTSCQWFVDESGAAQKFSAAAAALDSRHGREGSSKS